MSEDDLDKCERVACSPPESMERLMIGRLVSEVRKLKHELADPNYCYYSGRIHRQAILCRNAEIDDLREQLKKAKGGDS